MSEEVEKGRKKLAEVWPSHHIEGKTVQHIADPIANVEGTAICRSRKKKGIVKNTEFPLTLQQMREAGRYICPDCRRILRRDSGTSGNLWRVG